MAQAKAPVPWFPDAEFRRESDEVTRFFKEAVAAARDENRRLGIPNVQVDDPGRRPARWGSRGGGSRRGRRLRLL